MSTVLAQTNAGNGGDGSEGLGGAASVTGTGTIGGIGLNGGGGGGSGISGGAGGVGTLGVGSVGGAGGVAGTNDGAGAAGVNGGGGGGGAAGLVMSSSGTNNATVTGGSGGAGTANVTTSFGGGGGGGGGYGVIVNGPYTFTNTGAVYGGNAGSSVGGLEGVSGLGIYLGNNASLINSGSVIGGYRYTPAAAIYVAVGSISSITNNAGGIIGGTGGGIVNYGSLQSLTNNAGGVIGDTSTANGITNSIDLGTGIITNLTNAGSIFGFDGIQNNENGLIQNLYNTQTGTISAQYEAIYNRPDATIGNLVNEGAISSDDLGIKNRGLIQNLTNSTTGTIQASTAIYNDGSGTITSLTNSGMISGVAVGVYNGGLINTITNSNTISSGISGVNNDGGIIGTINNLGTGIIAGTDALLSIGIYNSDTIGTISTISTISTINNAGLITGTTYGIGNRGLIDTITNLGSITSGEGGYGIGNAGVITTLNNAQGGNTSSAATTALSLDGTVPNNYNIAILSSSHYGQLKVYDSLLSSPSWTINNFGIYGTPFITSRTYASVLTNNVMVTNLQAKYDNMTLALADNVDGTTLDLTFAGVSLMGTQQSLVNTANALAPIFTLQNTVLANSFSYDCNVFGENNVCISAGGRNTAVSAASGLNNTSALLIAAYRPHPNYRIGAYADQNLSVNYAGSTVTLGNNTPLIGLFGAWNERLDGTGTEVKVSAAYGQKNTTITRSVVGLSEPGSGSSSLNSQGAQATMKYGFAVLPEVIVSPYVGMRYTQNNMAGYTEGTSATVTAPLTYSALNTNATTALAGLGASYRFIPKATAFASAGVETDTNTANGSYSGTSSSIPGLTPVNFNANPVKTRPTATLGAYYDIEKNHRLGITGIYRQEAYQAAQTTTVMATYTVGL